MTNDNLWMRVNGILDVGTGMPLLTEHAGPQTHAKITHLSEAYGGPMSARPAVGAVGGGSREARSKFSRFSFVAVVVFCSLTVLAALMILAQYLVRRRNHVCGYLATMANIVSGGNGSRKTSESQKGPLVASGSSESPKHTNSLEKHQPSSDSLVDSPPPYQTAVSDDAKPGAYRQPLVSTGGSEASTESMAPGSNHPTAYLSSNQSWSEEPVQMSLDVTTGHLILSYMEEHLRNRDRLDADWEGVSSYESEEAVPCESAQRAINAIKNRAGCPVPYDQTRVLLSSRGNDYINASLMYDHNPRNPSYIAAESPLLGTVIDFWQMVWEQFAVVIVCLEPESALTQVDDDPFNLHGEQSDDVTSQARYWPLAGSMVFGKFEIRLVSEHSQGSDYITRSFYLKERESGETRTVTQFHFLSWPEDTPSFDVKTLLEFRRKVNKSFRAKKSPVIVHCMDGSSKTGAYLLLDVVLNRINKGVKELDVAASLEHLRDQRPGMIKTKGQFEFVLAAIAEEVNSMLNPVNST